MLLKNKKIGVAITGSFCTFSQLFPQLEALVHEGAVIQTICSDSAQTLDSRFGNHKDFLQKIETITGSPPIRTIPQAEPIGPKKLLDA